MSEKKYLKLRRQLEWNLGKLSLCFCLDETSELGQVMLLLRTAASSAEAWWSYIW